MFKEALRIEVAVGGGSVKLEWRCGVEGDDAVIGSVTECSTREGRARRVQAHSPAICTGDGNVSRPRAAGNTGFGGDVVIGKRVVDERIDVALPWNPIIDEGVLRERAGRQGTAVVAGGGVAEKNSNGDRI